MIKLSDNGVFLIGGKEILQPEEAQKKIQLTKEEASKNTIAFRILSEHNTGSDPDELKIRFDKLTSHDITYVGIIQTASD